MGHPCNVDFEKECRPDTGVRHGDAPELQPVRVCVRTAAGDARVAIGVGTR